MREGPTRAAPVVAGLLGVFITGFLIIATVVLFILSLVVVGEERSSSFANTFFIQCIIFTLILGAVIQLRNVVSDSLEIPHRGGAELLGLMPARAPVVLLATLAGASLTVPLGELDNLWQHVWPATEEEMLTMLAIYEPSSFFERIFIILALVVAAPLGEEMVFRGVMWTWLRDSSRPWIALIITSLLFGSAHVFIPRTIPLIVPVGLLLGFLVVRTGSILPSIAAHAAFNGTPLVAAWSGMVVTGWNNIGAREPRMSPTLLVGGTVLLASILALFWWITRERRDPPLPPAQRLDGRVDDDPTLH